MPDRIHLAVALDGAGWHPAAWRESGARPTELTSAGYWRDLIRTAEGASLLFATIEDALSLAGRSSEPDAETRRDRVRGRLDAVVLASFLAPVTGRIGLMPTVTTAHPEPFHVATGLQTLDHASHGRGGVRLVAGSTAQERANFGRRTDGPTALPASGRVEDDPALLAAFREAGEVAEVIRRLADSWEDDAIVRDVSTGRFLDRDRVHDIDYAGEFFSITGASIVPRSPQGQPLVTTLAHQSVPYRFAAEHADLVFVTPSDTASAIGILDELRDAADAVRTLEEPLRVFADLLVLVEETRATADAVWNRLEDRAALTTDAHVVVGTADDVVDEIAALAAAGVDGIRLRPARLPADLDAIAERVIPRAADAGILRPDDGAATLRERLGLPRPASRYARQEVGA
ncbi:Flavin-dependent oxidoreductase, luciferase family (includes alkanesulfonate monooxygenase SsuD and methylene tetrahydromethanopterin reductase) [Microbacterium sp. ru370.1]|uniref:LLM class flavin-dependent oxidoreductase n=1 Tax=unclassified Microbacterium TaxID=2609290 RepID=UPI000881020D|nr:MULTISPECIES: LLM class flavin-dependent oxidoreductase [unclassified Microbacterium]SDO37877.1 Flavin-dependent oxidoreductase, luciferase family (includes alkanesulfonate monooxygenase SsuD and methylene tetrahydromethanopterin reductase) [Microbacterium sp. ru370.1]SIT78704.1 Flavin-dependent oxidoreductase, luciferase family (includes alkanesulfonate monooxygenase SsuD and methylene tetrahydromethanopterin reductase) [Microbacterium sp. RU1D]